jgi:N-acetylmuramate 1-kinase
MKPARPAKAFVLAAGLGTRMLPLSRDLPKPMMPLWGRPILERILNLLRSWGVKEVVINLHHNPNEIWTLGRAFTRPNFRINFSFEPEILGTGGALRRAEWFLDDRPFWLINSDIAADLRPDALLKSFALPQCLAAVWLDPTLGPRTVEMFKGRITSFRSVTPGAKGTYTFCGLHLVSPQLLDFLPESGFAGIVPAYERAMKRGHCVAGVCVPGSFWADIGTPEQYLDAHRKKKRGGGAFASLGRRVRCERSVRVINSVVWDDAILRAGSVIENAIIGRGADVTGTVRYLAMRADRALDAVELQALKTRGWNPERATAYPMGPRGSARTFTRISVPGPLDAGRPKSSSPVTMILMRYSLEREENAFYCGHARFLRTIGFPVPLILLDWPEHRVALLEDLGPTALQDWIVGKPPSAIQKMYERVLNDVLILHEQGTACARRERTLLMPPFDERLYRWERKFFAEQFLEKRLRLPPRCAAAVQRDLARAAQELQKMPRVLIHRDLQSSNIILKGGRPIFIDFQGMRFGAAAYDLASLLCDPYVSLSESLQEELLEMYGSGGATPGATSEIFWWGAIQRLAQALGAFVRLSAIPGLPSFSRHIASATAMMRRALARVGGMRTLRSLLNDLPDA